MQVHNPRIMTKKNVTVRVPEDTYARFEEYRKSESGEISKADAGRRLLESGLNAEQSPDTPPGMDLLIATVAGLLGAVIALAILTYGITGAAVVAVAIVVGFGIAWVALSRDRPEVDSGERGVGQ